MTYSSNKKLGKIAAIKCATRGNSYAIIINDCTDKIALKGEFGSPEENKVLTKRGELIISEVTKLLEYCNGTPKK